MRIAVDRASRTVSASIEGARKGERTLGRQLMGAGMPRTTPPADLVALQRLIQRRPAGEASSEQIHEAGRLGTSGAGGPLPHLEKIQKAFGPHDVSSVRAHSGETAARASAAMGAEAFARGDHVAFARAPSLHTAAHEAAHVVQQRAGVQLQGGVGIAGDRYERAADAVADRVVAGRSADDLLPGGSAAGRSPESEIQRKEAACGTCYSPPDKPVIQWDISRIRYDRPGRTYRVDEKWWVHERLDAHGEIEYLWYDESAEPSPWKLFEPKAWERYTTGIDNLLQDGMYAGGMALVLTTLVAIDVLVTKGFLTRSALLQYAGVNASQAVQGEFDPVGALKKLDLADIVIGGFVGAFSKSLWVELLFDAVGTSLVDLSFEEGLKVIGVNKSVSSTVIDLAFNFLFLRLGKDLEMDQEFKQTMKESLEQRAKKEGLAFTTPEGRLAALEKLNAEVKAIEKELNAIPRKALRNDLIKESSVSLTQDMNEKLWKFFDKVFDDTNRVEQMVKTPHYYRQAVR